MSPDRGRSSWPARSPGRSTSPPSLIELSTGHGDPGGPAGCSSVKSRGRRAPDQWGFDHDQRTDPGRRRGGSGRIGCGRGTPRLGIRRRRRSSPIGKIVAAGGLNVRQLPTRHRRRGARLATARPSASSARCGEQRRRRRICGTSAPTLNEWYRARYADVGSAPAGPAATNGSSVGPRLPVTKRSRPPPPRRGRETCPGRDADNHLISELPGQSVGGNNRWY